MSDPANWWWLIIPGGLTLYIIIYACVFWRQHPQIRRKPTYDELLQTPEWKACSYEVRKEAGFICAMCDYRATQVHHKKTLYDRNGEKLVPWHPDYLRQPSLLVPLCGYHHWLEHRGRDLNLLQVYLETRRRRAS